MPLKHGSSQKIISENISELEHSKSKAGKKRSHLQNVAIALAEARKKKMAHGGMVDDDLDEDHETDIAEHMIQGDQPPVASPKTLEDEMILASKLHEESEKHEFYADGGLVEPMSGEEKPHVNMQEEHADPSLSEEQKKAIEHRKKSRKFMR